MSVLSAADDPAGDDSSDGNSEAALYEADYCSISTVAEYADADEDAGHMTAVHANGDHACFPPLNSSFSYDRAENGISRLDLNGDLMHVGEEREEGEEEEEADEEGEREASIFRAFSEDESRRNAPLTRENAARIVEAMRGVSFPGCPPDWVDRVPEDRWIDELRRLRSGLSTPAQQN